MLQVFVSSSATRHRSVGTSLAGLKRKRSDSVLALRETRWFLTRITGRLSFVQEVHERLSQAEIEIPCDVVRFIASHEVNKRS